MPEPSQGPAWLGDLRAKPSRVSAWLARPELTPSSDQLGSLPSLDSEHQTGLKQTLHPVLIIGSERHFDSVESEYSNIRGRIFDSSNHTSPYIRRVESVLRVSNIRTFDDDERASSPVSPAIPVYLHLCYED